MTQRHRLIILVIFLLAFAVAAPAVLLVTAGYRYDWKSNRVEKTGIIKLDSQPRGATVFINGRPQKEITPTSIFRLLPGDYDVRLELDGHLPWTKTLRVTSGATAISGIVPLFKSDIPSLVTLADPESGVLSDDGETAAYLTKRGTGLTELAARDLRTGTETVLERFPDGCIGCRLTMAPKGNRLLLEIRDQAGQTHWRIFSPTAGPDAKPVETALLPTATNPHWSSDGNRLSFTAPETAFVVEASDGSFGLAYAAPGLMDAAIKGHDLLTLRRQFPGVMLEKMPADGTGLRETVAWLPPGAYSFEGTDGRYLLLAESNSRRLLLLDFPAGRIATDYNANRGAWENADGTGRLAVWNDFELLVADSAGQSQIITRLGSQLAECAWHPAKADLIYATGNGLTAIELDDRGNRNVFELARLTGGGVFRLARDGSLLRFFGTIGNQAGLYERPL
ncbi:MAG: PEGA domain-containing protein [Patescibacteria group bacterium]|nr:PEGA domain-containing protein [Patescibacteria group bacterium]